MFTWLLLSILWSVAGLLVYNQGRRGHKALTLLTHPRRYTSAIMPGLNFYLPWVCSSLCKEWINSMFAELSPTETCFYNVRHSVSNQAFSITQTTSMGIRYEMKVIKYGRLHSGASLVFGGYASEFWANRLTAARVANMFVQHIQGWML